VAERLVQLGAHDAAGAVEHEEVPAEVGREDEHVAPPLRSRSGWSSLPRGAWNHGC